MGTTSDKPWPECVPASLQEFAVEFAEHKDLFRLLTNIVRDDVIDDFKARPGAEWQLGTPETFHGLPFSVSTRASDRGDHLVFTLSDAASPEETRRGFVQSMLYRQLLEDFQLLSSAGDDFAEGFAGDPDEEPVVPDEFDPLFAACGSTAALQVLLAEHGGQEPLLADLGPGRKDGDAMGEALGAAHQCIIEGAGIETKGPSRYAQRDVVGPATYDALVDMLSRFERVQVE